MELSSLHASRVLLLVASLLPGREYFVAASPSSLLKFNQSTAENHLWQNPFTLRVHYNYSTVSDFQPDFKSNEKHAAFARNSAYRARRQAPVHRRNPEENYEPFFFEGDILNHDPRSSAGETDTGLAFAAVRSEAQKWPLNADGIAVVPYKFEASVRERSQEVIRGVMKEFEKVCVRWQPQTANDKAYVLIRSPPQQVCAATLGRRSTESNVLYLNGACVVHKGQIMHEMMHVLGFYHEQSRADRDQYISVNWENITPDKKYQFKMYSAVDVDHLGFDYDYGSLMHYPTNAFASDGQSTTIVPLRALPPGIKIGQRETFSHSDLGKLRTLFKCKLQCDTRTHFRCADGSQCLNLIQKCDSVTNCPDGSDERNCKPKCPEYQFACPRKCIPRSWYCDGTRDCSDGSDEPAFGCPSTCSVNQFRCKRDGICIQNYKKCNGQRDCSDGEDESDKNCPEPPRPKAPPGPARPSQAEQQTFGDLCSNPQYYMQFFQYCYFNYRQRRVYQQDSYFDPYLFQTLGFDPIVGGVVNFACGLPINDISNAEAQLDFDYIMQNELCNNLIIHSAVIKYNHTSHTPQIQLPPAAEKLVHSLRTKIKAIEAKKAAYKNDRPRKMEIYLSIGGRGTTRMLSDWVAQGPTHVERFANASRAYARRLDVDGIVLDWRSDDIYPLQTLTKQLEKALRTDSAKNAAKIDLLMGVIVTDGLVKSQNKNKLALADLTSTVDFVMYVSSTQGEARDYNSLLPNNKLFLDTVQAGLLKFGGPGGSPTNITNLSKKFFLPFNLGAKQYAANHEEPNTFDSYALGPAFDGTVSSDPGRLTAGEACSKFSKPEYTKETREYFSGAAFTHERVAFRAGKDFASFETPCSVAEKIKLFQARYKKDALQLYAGIYVPDITLDDTKGVCGAGAAPFSLLSVIAQANPSLDIPDLMAECAKQKDFSWKTTLSLDIRRILSEKRKTAVRQGAGGDQATLPTGLSGDAI